MFTHVKEDTLNIRWLLLIVSYHQFFFHISSFELHTHASVHVGILVACHCMQWQTAVVKGMMGGAVLELHM